VCGLSTKLKSQILILNFEVKIQRYQLWICPCVRAETDYGVRHGRHFVTHGTITEIKQTGFWRLTMTRKIILKI
jgi:hypothetical protein